MQRIVVLATFSVLVSAFAGSGTNVVVEPSPENSLILKVTVWNSTPDAVKVFPESLPWEKNAMILFAVAANSARGKPLPESGSIFGARPMGKRITLASGKSLTGEIDLKERFPGIDTELRQNDVIIFWSYQTKGDNRLALNRVNGTLALPARKNEASGRAQ